jgi:hypothetical protein
MSTSTVSTRRATLLTAGLLALAAGCGGGVSSEETARRAYFGLDRYVDRGINLGMAGFNAASSANIPAQTAMGDVSGTLTVTGQVDQGASANKGMRLRTALANYSDRVAGDDGGSERNSGELELLGPLRAGAGRNEPDPPRRRLHHDHRHRDLGRRDVHGEHHPLACSPSPRLNPAYTRRCCTRR